MLYIVYMYYLNKLFGSLKLRSKLFDHVTRRYDWRIFYFEKFFRVRVVFYEVLSQKLYLLSLERAEL